MHPQPPSPAPSPTDVPDLLRQVLRKLDDLHAVMAGVRKDYLTVDEVARHLGRSAYTVRRYIAEGRLRAVRVDGTGPRGRLLIPTDQLAALVRQGLGGAVRPLAVPPAAPE